MEVDKKIEELFPNELWNRIKQFINKCYNCKNVSIKMKKIDNQGIYNKHKLDGKMIISNSLNFPTYMLFSMYIWMQNFKDRILAAYTFISFGEQFLNNVKDKNIQLRYITKPDGNLSRIVFNNQHLQYIVKTLTTIKWIENTNVFYLYYLFSGSPYISKLENEDFVIAMIVRSLQHFSENPKYATIIDKTIVALCKIQYNDDDELHKMINDVLMNEYHGHLAFFHQIEKICENTQCIDQLK